MIEARRAALVMIDMQNGFIAPSSALCVPGAAATVGACADALAAARRQGMEVVHVRRAYAADGSDVEPVRHGAWLAGGRPLCVEGDDPSSLDCPDVLTPADGERVLLKPRFSAFFGTPLDRALRRAGVDAVVLTGTALPNCVRSTAYDALSLNYNVAVVSDATSSRTPTWPPSASTCWTSPSSPPRASLPCPTRWQAGPAAARRPSRAPERPVGRSAVLVSGPFSAARPRSRRREDGAARQLRRL